MLNIEKYKEEINEAINDRYVEDILCEINENIMGERPLVDCCYSGSEMCENCHKNVMKWLLEEYEEPILDDIERKYLSAVIKPFRKRIKSIKKVDYPSNSAFISIAMDKCEYIFLPVFELNSGMYQRMEINKEYTLEELGL